MAELAISKEGIVKKRKKAANFGGEQGSSRQICRQLIAEEKEEDQEDQDHQN